MPSLEILFNFDMMVKLREEEKNTKNRNKVAQFRKILGYMSKAYLFAFYLQ